MHRSLKAWGQANSFPFGCAGDLTTNGDASWTHNISPTEKWANPGGDFDPTSSASQIITTVGPYTWGPTVGLTQDVQNWVDNPNQNFGWIFVGAEQASGSAKGFSSLESINCADNSNCPRIEIDYTPDLVDVSAPGNGGSFHLTAVVPNPSPGKTGIHFSLAQSGPARLSIFNVRGRHIATLVDGILEAGSHLYDFRGLDKRGNLVMSGVYIARLEVGGEMKSRKFVLAR